MQAFPSLSLTPPAVSRWRVALSVAGTYRYDLPAGLPDGDYRDPVIRYLRRSRSALAAATSEPELFMLMRRPPMRFDLARRPHRTLITRKWQLPILTGDERQSGTLTVPLPRPVYATLKHPEVSYCERFLRVNWGGIVQVFSVDDLLRRVPGHIPSPGELLRVGVCGGQLETKTLPIIDDGGDYFVVTLKTDIALQGEPTASRPLIPGRLRQGQLRLLKVLLDGRLIGCGNTRFPAWRLAALPLTQLPPALRPAGIDIELDVQDTVALAPLYNSDAAALLSFELQPAARVLLHPTNPSFSTR